jgi:hypothetical protein
MRPHTRRAVLERVGGSVVGLLGLPPLLCAPRIRWTTVPTVVGSDGVRARRSAPVDWVDREREARRVGSALAARDDVVRVTRTNAAETVGDWHTPKLVAEVDSRATSPDDGGRSSSDDPLPESLADEPEADPLTDRPRAESVPVETRAPGGHAPGVADADPDVPATADCYGRSRALHAGEAIGIQTADGDPLGTVSLGWAVFDAAGNERAITCAHQFETVARCELDPGDPRPVVRQHGETVGEIVDTDPDQDLSIVSLGVGDRPLSTDLPASGTMGGVETGWGLHALRALDETVVKSTWATCRTTGRITSVEQTSSGCLLNRYGGDRRVRCAMSTTPGDSGGPIYHEYRDDGRTRCAFVGLVSSSHDAGSLTATAGYRIAAANRLTFA